MSRKPLPSPWPSSPTRPRLPSRPGSHLVPANTIAIHAKIADHERAALQHARGRTGGRAAVRSVLQAAFAGDVEADLVTRLNEDGDVLFGLVAEINGHVIGHVVFSRLPIETAGDPIIAAALAPLAVLPGWQWQGIGAALVGRGLALCREWAVPAVVVLGDPAYYGRFGFRAETAREVQTPWSGPQLMAIDLATPGKRLSPGIARYPVAFTACSAE